MLENIAVASGVTPQDLVIEVGPGTGNLTKHILSRAGQVIAVEKDDRLFAKLQKEYGKVDNLKLIHGDILQINLDQIITEMLGQPRSPLCSTHERQEIPSTSQKKVKVVANLPYNITKEFLNLMLPLGNNVSELSIMIQHEVAQRLIKSQPGDANYRAMSLRVQYFSKPKYKFRIPRGKYYPVPGVDGAFVTFALLPPGSRLAVPDEARFLMLVNKAFSERRKMMRNTLQPFYSSAQVEDALVAARLSPEVRAQDLAVEDFGRLAWALHNAYGPLQPRNAVEIDAAGMEDKTDL